MSVGFLYIYTIIGSSEVEVVATVASVCGMRRHIWARLPLRILWLLLNRLALLGLLCLLLLLLKRVVEVWLHHGELIRRLHWWVLELMHVCWLLGRWWRCMWLALPRLWHIVELLVLLTLETWWSDHTSTVLENVTCCVRRWLISLTSKRLLFCHLLASRTVLSWCHVVLLLIEGSCGLERHRLAVHHSLLLLLLGKVANWHHLILEVATVSAGRLWSIQALCLKLCWGSRHLQILLSAHWLLTTLSSKLLLLLLLK